MKTIEEAAIEYINDKYEQFALLDIIGEATSIKDFRDDFKAGVEFSQQFYLIERDQYADIDLNQKEELERNMPILVKYLNEDGETTYDVFAEYYPVLQDPIYTHWRPINLK